ncbi:MAG TPA: YlbF family regulator [Candidatus Choladousia intestinigallinarum]|nr:YlbF family regulator [Candidatus Choladousia intestinigallinarum]
MKQVEMYTKQLVQAIQESQEYQEFCEVREELRRQPELRERMNEMRRMNFELQSTAPSEELYRELNSIWKEFREFRKNPLADEFLKAELAMCRMLQQINNEITSAVDLDTEEIVEQLSF